MSPVDKLNPLRPTVDANVQTGEPFRFLSQPLLADTKLRYVGEAIALVIAETRHQALDAAERVVVDADALPAVTQADRALVPGSPVVADEVPGNLCFDWQWGQSAEVASALKSAARTVTIDLDNHRIVTSPMEPRGAVGVHDPATGRTTLFVSSQSIHTNRDTAARVLGVDPSMIRFVAPDVGGGFGAKNFAYSEHALILWAARRTGRAVKWIATRSEVFLSDHQARDHLATATLALTAEGRFLALHVDSIANLGAYMAGGSGGVQTNQYVHLQGTVYDIPAVSLRVRAALTNTTPIGVTRGPGFGEASNIIERLIDAAAYQCGFDRIDLRRQNFVQQTPMTNALNFVVDSGDFRRHFDTAVDVADLAGFSARRADAEQRGRRRGLGIVCHIKGTGGLPTENVDIRFERDGTVSLITGTQTIGQGHETTMPQIVADRLGVPEWPDHAQTGRHRLDPDGRRPRQLARHLYGRHGDPSRVRNHRSEGQAHCRARAGGRRGGHRFRRRRVPRRRHRPDDQRCSTLPRWHGEQNEPLDTYHQWTREAMTFPNGTHVAEIEIDPETGTTTLERLTAVDDYGVLVNPMVAAGPGPWRDRAGRRAGSAGARGL